MWYDGSGKPVNGPNSSCMLVSRLGHSIYFTWVETLHTTSVEYSLFWSCLSPHVRPASYSGGTRCTFAICHATNQIYKSPYRCRSLCIMRRRRTTKSPTSQQSFSRTIIDYLFSFVIVLHSCLCFYTFSCCNYCPSPSSYAVFINFR